MAVLVNICQNGKQHDCHSFLSSSERPTKRCSFGNIGFWTQAMPLPGPATRAIAATDETPPDRSMDRNDRSPPVLLKSISPSYPARDVLRISQTPDLQM